MLIGSLALELAHDFLVSVVVAFVIDGKVGQVEHVVTHVSIQIDRFYQTYETVRVGVTQLQLVRISLAQVTVVKVEHQ